MDGVNLLSNVIASQTDLHAPHGGVVPEVAARQHILQIAPVIQQAVTDASLHLEDIDAVSVTYGPGLAGSLLVGVNAAKGLSLSMNLPLIGVNHLEGHIYAAWLTNTVPDNTPGFPLVCLIASGGHTDLILMTNHGTYQSIGYTRDDAAGEAFDKAARILGLGFPGGPEIEKTAKPASKNTELPRAWLKGSFDFSFSGLKTAILHKAQEMNIYPHNNDSTAKSITDLATAFQESVVDILTQKTIEASKVYDAKGIIVGGGVAANSLLRQSIQSKSSLPVIIPNPILCTDNGAMIASCAYYRLQAGHLSTNALDIDPSLELGREHNLG